MVAKKSKFEVESLNASFIFVKTIDAGSLSAAARTVNLTPSAVSKKITKLENTLGVVLLRRDARKIALTEAGLQYYRGCSQGFSSIFKAEDEITSLSDQARGVLRVRVGQKFGRQMMAPLIPQFLQKYPGIQIEMVLGSQGHWFDYPVDIVISSSDHQNSNMIVRSLIFYDSVTCAAPSYLERHSAPRTVEELEKHNCLISIKNNSHPSDWLFHFPGGWRRVPVVGNFQTNSNEVLLLAALAGVGIAHMPRYVVSTALNDGRLTALTIDGLVDSEVRPPISMKVFYPPAKHRSKKVTVFVDFLIQHFPGEAFEAEKACELSLSAT